MLHTFVNCVRELSGAHACTGIVLNSKKIYAIRDSNPENLLGRQKCYPYTNSVSRKQYQSTILRNFVRVF